MPGRILFLEWIYDVGRVSLFSSKKQSKLQKEIIAEVRKAVESLPSAEREFIELYWFEGRSLTELSELYGKRPHKLDSLNKRILLKLRRKLAPYVEAKFGIGDDSSASCVLCSSPFRDEIDKLLETKKPEETFRRINRILRSEYGLRITTPQILIGHIKYHTRKEASDAG